MDADLRSCIETEGIEVSDAAFSEAARYAVESFAPNCYQAIIWRLTSHDAEKSRRVWRRVQERGHGRDFFELRPGIVEALEELRGRGFRLGLAANQPLQALDRLVRHGIAGYFGNQGVAGVYGLRKPDPRLFLRVCDDLGVRPEECVMVGDRIDNDIAPAKLLGMKTVLFRTGRHRDQRPRTWEELPEAEITDVGQLLPAIELLAGEER